MKTVALSEVSSAAHLYRFKDITTVPGAKDVIDIVLSKTQRKTPTVVHPQYDIRRIRSFYMRKVKFAQQTFHDRFSLIVNEFPKLDEIHPFYATLCAVLYDKNHFKLALGQVNSVRATCDTLAKEYVRLLKYADSPYKCKMLKRAALGRMCTTVKKLAKALSYLESVRQELSRLPAINPFSKAIVLAGFPNVGKSTMMNALSNANVETAPWSFTTKSLYVGHFDYLYEKWQVIDTPGVLDRPLKERNVIEVQALTAMSYLTAAILFMVDISGACGHSVLEQVALFHSLYEALVYKPVIVVLNKIDLRAPSDLTEEEQAAIRSMAEGVSPGPSGATDDPASPKVQGIRNIKFVAVSTLTRENLDRAKNEACEALIKQKDNTLLLAGKAVASGAYIARAANPRPAPTLDLPPRVLIRKPTSSTTLSPSQPGEEGDDIGDVETAPSILERVEAEGGAGVFNPSWREHWQLANAEWVDDAIPEIFAGKNIADFIDVDIDAKLAALELEEAETVGAWDASRDAPTAEWAEMQAVIHAALVEKETRRLVHALKAGRNGVRTVRSVLDEEKFRKHLESVNVAPEEVLAKLNTPCLDSALTDDDINRLIATAGGAVADNDDDLDLDRFDDGQGDEEGEGEGMGEGERKGARKGEDSATVMMKKKKMRQVVRSKATLLQLTRTAGALGKKVRKVSGVKKDGLVAAAGGNALTADLLRKSIVRTNQRYAKPKKSQPKDQVREADRSIFTKKPKHLYSGKSGMGTSAFR